MGFNSGFKGLMYREETSESQLPTTDDKFWSFPAVIQEEAINFKN